MLRFTFTPRLWSQDSKSKTFEISLNLFTSLFFYSFISKFHPQMDLHFFIFFNKSCFILTTIIFLAYLTVESLSLGSNSSSCFPQNCGNGPNISFPFWLLQQQEPSCGSPGFNITCKNNYPVLMISGDDYLVKDIFYSNNSVNLVGMKAFNETNLCPIPLRNFSVDGSPFSYSSLSVDLYFFYNCTSPYAEMTYSIHCPKNGSHLSSFGVFHPEILKKHNYSIDLCQSSVHVPVHVDSINVLLNDNYTDVLRKGFILEWQCSNCDKHGIYLFLEIHSFALLE